MANEGMIADAIKEAARAVSQTGFGTGLNEYETAVDGLSAISAAINGNAQSLEDCFTTKIPFTGDNINVADAIDKSANALFKIAKAIEDLCFVVQDKKFEVTVYNEGE